MRSHKNKQSIRSHVKRELIRSHKTEKERFTKNGENFSAPYPLPLPLLQRREVILQLLRLRQQVIRLYAQLGGDDRQFVVEDTPDLRLHLRNPESAAIERVLERRDRIYRDAAKNFRGSTSDAAQHFARELQRIDTRDCPTEFRVAYQDVVTAWEISIPYLAADTPVTLVFEGVFGWLTNDFSGIGSSKQQAQLATQQLQAAHQSLDRIAVAYGASIPTR